MYTYYLQRMWLCAIALSALVFGGRAEAAFIINISQNGNDVVATGIGECNMSALTDVANGYDVAFIAPQFHGIYLGPASVDSEISLWGAISGPSNFGVGGVAPSTSGTGSIVGISDANLGLNLAVPYGYVSSTFLSGTATWSDQTLSGLGIVPGSYTWAWGSGTTTDSLILNATVPEPNSVGLLVAIAVGGRVHRRRFPGAP